MFKEEIILTLHELFQKIEEEENASQLIPRGQSGPEIKTKDIIENYSRTHERGGQNISKLNPDETNIHKILYTMTQECNMSLPSEYRLT